jgi:transglutaminase-like putative cysteine protease
MKKFLLLFLILLFAFSGKALAATENFSTSYNVLYDISENESTRVTLNIGLKNKTSDYYAASYSVQTGFDDISNIRVADGSGDLSYKTEKNDKGVEISFDFIEKTVGIDNTHKFSVSFDTREIAKNMGSVWEVNIPGIANQESYSAFNVEVKTPSSIGPPSIIKPQTGNVRSRNNTLIFTKNDLGSGGISIAYGLFQTYKFNLRYHLHNNNLFPTNTEIAIPSNNTYQEVYIEDINPKPRNVIMDNDGNWLAQYRLLPSQDLSIIVTGHANIRHQPVKDELTHQQRNQYLKADKYWQVNDPEIQKLAKELKTPEAIYEYVVKNLKYDSERIKERQIREGAKGVLLNKESAVCLEFTDLFVTLSRAAGIPARAVEGYANTSNSADRPLSLVEDVLHAWPEYYDSNKKTWVMVDPTWGNTTKGIDYFNVLDFDHFAFVIKGEDSDYPVPAGGYKTSKSKNLKNVNVVTSRAIEDSKPKIKLSTDFKDKYYGGLPLEGNIIVTNASKIIAPGQTINITTEDTTPNSQNLYFDSIPTFGYKDVHVKLHTPQLLTNTTYKVKITVGDETIEKIIIVLPFYKNTIFIIGAGGLLIGTFLLILSLFIYRSRRLHFPQ